MAWTNAQGKPIALTPLSIQIDVPSEPAADMTAANWGAVIKAAVQLVFALAKSDPVAIAAAIQALINAFLNP